MIPQAPTPRYYDTRAGRRALIAGGLAAAVGLGGGGWFLWRQVISGGGASEAVSGQVPTGVLPGGGRIGSSSVPANGESGGIRSTLPGRFTSVAMVGDSITAASKNALTYALAGNGFTSIQIDGVKSRRIDVGDGKGEPLAGIKTMFQMIAAKVPADVWVVALGTNDVGLYAGIDDYGRIIDEALALLPATMPLVWVDVYRPEYLPDTNRFNLLLAERLQRRGHAVVADWYGEASKPNEKVLVDDHIHPNADGTAVFAGLVVAAIARLAPTA
jgi:lysophospholipase L1-like esterase